MKRLLAILLLFAFIFLVGCNQTNKAKPWCEDDFLFYDKEGNVAQRPEEDTLYYIVVSSADVGATHRGVSVGDDAIEALKKYDLSCCYGKAICGTKDTTEILTADVDIENLISTAEGEVFFSFSFDKEYNPIHRASSLQSGITPPKEMHFWIMDGKISRINVFNISPYWLTD